MSQLLRGTVFYILGFGSIYCAVLAYKIWRMPPWEYDKIVKKGNPNA